MEAHVQQCLYLVGIALKLQLMLHCCSIRFEMNWCVALMLALSHFCTKFCQRLQSLVLMGHT